VRGHVGGLADFGLDEDVRLYHEILPGPLRDGVPLMDHATVGEVWTGDHYLGSGRE